MSIGNHELYVYADTLDMYKNFAPKLNGRYLSSNVNITVADEHGNPVSVPVGERFVKFQTRKGRKVTSVGVLYDFTGNDHNTTVQTVADMVEEQWFKEAIAEEPDFFLLVGSVVLAPKVALSDSSAVTCPCNVTTGPPFSMPCVRYILRRQLSSLVDTLTSATASSSTDVPCPSRAGVTWRPSGG